MLTRPANRLETLIERHPVLFRGEPPIRSTLPEGWFAVVDALCDDLEVIIGGQAQAFTVDHIKQKFARLQFHWRFERGISHSQETSVQGGRPDQRSAPQTGAQELEVRSGPGGLYVIAASSDPIIQQIDTRVRAAETEANATCEWCGKAGQAWVGGYWYVACDAHREDGSFAPDEWVLLQEDRRKRRQERES